MESHEVTLQTIKCAISTNSTEYPVLGAQEMHHGDIGTETSNLVRHGTLPVPRGPLVFGSR